MPWLMPQKGLMRTEANPPQFAELTNTMNRRSIFKRVVAALVGGSMVVEPPKPTEITEAEVAALWAKFDRMHHVRTMLWDKDAIP